MGVLPPQPTSKIEPTEATVAWFPSLAHGLSSRPSAEGNGLGRASGWACGEVEGCRPAGSRSLWLGWWGYFAVGSFTVVPSPRAPVVPYFFGPHSHASFSASDIWAGAILLATSSRSSPGEYLEAARLDRIWAWA